MENISYTKQIRGNWHVIALFAGIAVVLSLLISLVQPFKYRAMTQLLIIQKQTNNLDAYTATKSAEKIGKNLSTIVYTSSFYTDVINSAPEIRAHFPTQERERRKEWQKNIDAYVIPETGILSVAVYAEDKEFGARLARTIANTIVHKGSDYHGGGAGVEIKIVDDVVLSTYPVRPNIPLHGVLALMLGTIAGISYVILRASAQAESVRETVTTPINQVTTPASIEQAKDAREYEQPSTRGWEFVQPVAEAVTPRATADQLLMSIKTMHDHLAR